MEEEELIEQLKRGNRDAKEIFVEKYSGFLFNVVFQVTRRKNLSEDIVENSLILALKEIKKFKKNSKLSTWVYRITVNRTKFELLMETRHKEYEKDAMEKTIDNPTPKEYKKDRKKDIIWQGMEHLNDREREIITLIDIEGMKYNKASEMLNVPVGTIRSRIARARQHLKEEIIKWNFFGSDLSNK